jgi:hypothetical protein
VKIAGRHNKKPNKIIDNVSEMFLGCIQEEVNRINMNLHNLDTNQRLNLFTKFISYIIPWESSDETEGKT